MAKIFNPPPNWPAPPPGWMPDPGWRPDPSWGPAPPGWQFWIESASDRGSPPMASPSSEETHELRIFLSYRRSDCQAQANGLYDGLRHRLPDARVFMDIDSIPAGVDFEEHIQREISSCDLVLVMIGDNWLDARPGSDVRRLDEPEDFVRLEIESALASPSVRTLPVLVEGAQMPRAVELPESIVRLARINAIELSDMRWRSDLDRLVDVVEGLGREKGMVVTHATVQDARHEPAPSFPEPSGVSAVTEMPGVVVWLPLITVGLGGWVPALWAGLKRPAADPTRTRLFGLSGILLVAALAGFTLVGVAPEDAAGEKTGPLMGVGSAVLVITIIAGMVSAFALRKGPPAR